MSDNTPEDNEGIRRIVEEVKRAAFDRAAEEPIGGEQIHFMSDLEGLKVPPREWCITDWVPDHVVTMLSGDGGTGKSLLAQQLASACALGMPFMGIEVPRRKVLYFAAEDDMDEMHRRQADINEHFDCSFADYEQQLAFVNLRGDEALLCEVDGKNSRKLRRTQTYDQLVSFCRGNGIQLLIVDTVADTFGGLEIDRQQVTKFVRMIESIARDTRGAAIIVAHPGVAGMANGTGISGSTAWRNAVRSVLYLRRPTEEECDGPEARDLRILERLKGNFSASNASLRIAWWRGHFVLSDIADGGPAIDVVAAEAKVMAALRVAVGQGRMLTFGVKSTYYAPKILRPYRETKGLTYSHIERAVAAMIAKGEIREAWVGPRSRPRAVIVPADWPLLEGERGQIDEE